MTPFSAALLCLLPAALAAAVSSPQFVTQAADIGSAPFQLVGSSANAVCASSIAHGAYSAPPAVPVFAGFGVEATMMFSEVSAAGAAGGSRVPCGGRNNSAAVVVLLSQAELMRQSGVAAAFLRLPAAVLVKVFLAGVDTDTRRCGAFSAGAPAYYAFTKEIDAFLPLLERAAVTLPAAVRASGDKWMLAYTPVDDALCVYVDATAPTYLRYSMAAKNATAPTEPAAVPVPDAGSMPAANSAEGATPDVTIVAPMLPSPAVSPQTLPAGGPADAPTESSVLCFPGSATVELADGSVKAMRSVAVGDEVKVANGVFSDVFMFTHRMTDVTHSFVYIETSTGAKLALTAGHYLYVNGALAAAKTVRVGHALESASGDMMTVTAVSAKTMSGLYNPQTTHGDIVVDGVRASTFTTAVLPRVAQALLAPLRSAYGKIGFTTGALDHGSDFLARRVPSGAALLV